MSLKEELAKRQQQIKQELEQQENKELVSELQANVRHLEMCHVCKTQPLKYTCPGCKIKSCSLDCVNRHKQTTKCTGKRKIEYIKKEDYSINDWQNDCNFLNGLHVQKLPKLKPRNKGLKRMAYKMGIFFVEMVGMEKERHNTTFYRKDEIFWTVSFKFNQQIHLVHKIASSAIFRNAVDQVCAKCFVYFDNDSYRHVDASLTLAEILKGQIVNEYPEFLLLAAG